jgi:hypothetical protein
MEREPDIQSKFNRFWEGFLYWYSPLFLGCLLGGAILLALLFLVLNAIVPLLLPEQTY